MASNKDILEAQRYNRKRLISAFISGTPGGREVETKSRMVPLILGVVLSVALVVAAVVLGRFVSPTLPDNWENHQYLVDKDTGARYYSLSGVLHPVANVTSARLLTDRFTPQLVSGKALAGIPRGKMIGIPDAPEDVPTPSQLTASEWFSCTDAEGKPRTWIGQQPEDFADADLALIKNKTDYYLVEHGRRHLISGTTDEINRIRVLPGFSGESPHEAQANWVTLFHDGTPIQLLTWDGIGNPLQSPAEALRDRKNGDVVAVQQNPEADPENYLVTGSSTVEKLSKFGYWMWLAKNTNADPVNITAEELATLQIVGVGEGIVPADWPTDELSLLESDRRPCIRLTAGEEGAAQLGLGSVPVATIDALSPTDTVFVDGGAGALVEDTDGTLGAYVLITDAKLSYSLGKTDDVAIESMKRLGYGDPTGSDGVKPLKLRTAWLALVPTSQIELSNPEAQESLS